MKRKRMVSQALRPPIIFGLAIENVYAENLLDTIKFSTDLGISFIVLNLNTYKLANNEIPSTFDGMFLPFGQSDLSLKNEYWRQRIVSYISQYHLELINTELNWSAYVGVRSIMLDVARFLSQESDNFDLLDRVAQLSRLLQSSLIVSNMPTIWLLLDISEYSWNTWRMIYEMCNYSNKLKLALIIDSVDEDILFRWLSEPVKAAVFNSNIFRKSSSRLYFSDANITLLMSNLLKRDIKVIINGYNYGNLPVLNTQNENNPLYEATLYMNKDRPDVTMESSTVNTSYSKPSLFNEEFRNNIEEILKCVKTFYGSLSPPSVREIYTRGYLDVLQTPLQPLRDNLDSMTYEEFERCDSKYNLYEEAIYQCLSDLILEGLTNPTIYIVGAGRGPLVECSINALLKLNMKEFVIYALEKNPCTMFTLEHRINMKERGWENVRVINSDMRDFVPPKLADVVVSELLGPFGDNELSPECIDGIQKVFGRLSDSKKIRFIPQNYESYVSPIHSPQLWSDINSFDENKRFHMPYTVALHSVYTVSDQQLPCFYYEHPKENIEEDNDRYKQLRFTAKNDCCIHGFAGYFKCTLYKKIIISILPGEMDDIKSWFPMYFPINRPMHINKSQVITLHIWRKHDNTRVWYEWVFTTPTTSIIHNINGFAHSIMSQ